MVAIRLLQIFKGTTEMTVKPLQLIRERAWNGPWAHLPKNVADYPSMLSLEERKMLGWLTEHYFSGAGIVCDLGFYLGGSTISLADGLRRAGRTGKLIQAYDFYEIGPKGWEKHMASRGFEFPSDGNALPLVEKMTSDYADLITFNKGDFCQSPVPEAPIEICFVDISKSPELNDHIIKSYFSKLIPGQSIVVQQDYFFRAPPWDIATMEILSDYFEPLSFADINSAVFLNTKQIDDHAIEISSSKHFSKELFIEKIKAASRHFPFAVQRAQLYKALRAVQAGSNEVREKAWKNRFKIDEITAEEVYSAFDS